METITLKTEAMTYHDKKDLYMMIWEKVTPNCNLNKEIKFNTPNLTEVNVGDIINCYRSIGRNMSCKITEIIEVRPSSMSKMNYVTAKADWFAR